MERNYSIIPKSQSRKIAFYLHQLLRSAYDLKLLAMRESQSKLTKY